MMMLWRRPLAAPPEAAASLLRRARPSARCRTRVAVTCDGAAALLGRVSLDAHPDTSARYAPPTLLGGALVASFATAPCWLTGPGALTVALLSSPQLPFSLSLRLARSSRDGSPPHPAPPPPASSPPSGLTLSFLLRGEGALHCSDRAEPVAVAAGDSALLAPPSALIPSLPPTDGPAASAAAWPFACLDLGLPDLAAARARCVDGECAAPWASGAGADDGGGGGGDGAAAPPPGAAPAPPLGRAAVRRLLASFSAERRASSPAATLESLAAVPAASPAAPPPFLLRRLAHADVFALPAGNRVALLFDPAAAPRPGEKEGEEGEGAAAGSSLARPDLTFAVEMFAPGHVTPRHVHLFGHELFVVLRGAAVAECDGVRFPVAAGDCLVFPPGCVHGLDVPPGCGRCDCAVLLLPNDSFAEMVRGAAHRDEGLGADDFCSVVGVGC